MLLRKAERGDYPVIARLHSESIRTGFLSSLGNAVLVELYRAIDRTAGSIVVVAEMDERVVGFIAGTICTKALYKNVIIMDWYRFVVPILKSIVTIRTLRMIIETLLYGLKGNASKFQDTVGAELLVISVDESVRGEGIGKKLVSALDGFFKTRNITAYKVVTFSKDENANRFYVSCGFEFHRSFQHHANNMFEYIKAVS